ncbi:MAG: DUF4097 family beta strand repeat-containing protein [Lachnospiraceae bacterium]|nr:DUF4097 family beta strand repeat-containing protein [Lachnospiraceae bacterium]
MKSLKTLYIVLIFVITAIIIAVVLGFRFSHIKNNLSGINIFTSSDLKTESGKLSAFNDIDIEGDVISFTVKEGEDYSYEFNYPEELSPEIYVKDDCLYIKVKAEKAINLKLVDGVHVDETFKLTVYVPEGTNFGKLTANVDAGEIKLDGYEFDSMDVDADAANVGLMNIISGRTDIKADAGNVIIKKSSTGDIAVSTDAGNVEFTDVKSGDVNVETDLGNIEFSEVSFDCGDFTSSMGNIEIDGEFNEVTADCSLGVIDIDTPNENAKIDAEVELGSISVNGKKIHGKKFDN